MPSARSATPDDLASIVAMTRMTRTRLAQWAPVYFRRREHADDAHAAFLAFLVEAPDQEATVVAAGDGVIGFWRTETRPGFTWVDDLCSTDGRWDDVVGAVDVPPPWGTCVSPLDSDRRTALAGAGLDVASTYWNRLLDDVEPDAGRAGAQPEPPPPPRHTFGPIDAAADGALAVVDAVGNWAIGSPGVEPPLYDPGGPTTVVDRLGGPDLDAAIGLALAASAARGDAQLVVVADAADADLTAALDNNSFTNPIELWMAT